MSSSCFILISIIIRWDWRYAVSLKHLQFNQLDLKWIIMMCKPYDLCTKSSKICIFVNAQTSSEPHSIRFPLFICINIWLTNQNPVFLTDVYKRLLNICLNLCRFLSLAPLIMMWLEMSGFTGPLRATGILQHLQRLMGNCLRTHTELFHEEQTDVSQMLCFTAPADVSTLNQTYSDVWRKCS